MARHNVLIENRIAVTQSSGHEAIAPADVCLTPVGTAMVPIPYVNRVASRALCHGSTMVRIADASVMLQGSQLRPSSGNEAGTGGGVLSRTTRGPAIVLQGSLTVTIEGAHVARDKDTTLQNGKNAVGHLRST